MPASATSTAAVFVPLVIRTADKIHPPLSTVTFAYDPSRIAALIARWGEIVALGLNPYTARGLVRPNVETRDAPKLPIRSKHFHGDGLTWAALVADVERAWMALLGDYESPDRRLRYNIVGYRMQGLTLGDIGRKLRVRKEVVVEEHKHAVLLMALVLGYEEPPVADGVEVGGLTPLE